MIKTFYLFLIFQCLERREPKYEIVLEKEFTPEIIQDNQSEQFLLPEWKSFSDPTQNPEKVKPVDKTRTNMNQRSQHSHSLFSSQPFSSYFNPLFLLFIVIHVMQWNIIVICYRSDTKWHHLVERKDIFSLVKTGFLSL